MKIMANDIAALLYIANSLQELHLVKNTFHTGGTIYISIGFKNLSVFSISNNKIRVKIHDVSKYIMEALTAIPKTNPLTSRRYSKNSNKFARNPLFESILYCRQHGCCKKYSILSCNINLQPLHLQKNELKSKGIIFIKEALNHTKILIIQGIKSPHSYSSILYCRILYHFHQGFDSINIIVYRFYFVASFEIYFINQPCIV